MFRSIFQLNQQLSGLLLQVPELVDLFERKSPHALTRLMAWIDRTEEMLSSHRLTEAADFAGLKSRILAPIFDDDRHGTLRRRQLAIAIGLIHDFQDVLQQALRPRALKIAQARETARQLLQIVAQSGAIKYDPASAFEEMVERIWLLCTQHDQLKPLAAQLKVLLPTDDIRILLAEELDPADFVGG